MITIAADVHLKTTTFSVRNAQGERIMREKVENKPELVRDFIRQFPDEKQFAMEATFNWPLFHNLLKDEVDIFHLLHPKKLRAIIDSQTKTDAHDSDELSYLTHAGYIPLSYKADPDTQIFRRFLRTRVRMSFTMASIKNQIHALLNSYIFYGQRPTNFKNLFCKRGLLYLSQVVLPEKARTLINHLLLNIARIKEVQESLDREIEAVNFKPCEQGLLKTMPGMKGKVIRYIVLSEIDSIERFRNARALVAYSGLIPRQRSSGEKVHKGRLRSDINHFLRWALLEAVYPAILTDKSLKRYYKDVKERTNASSAKVACARKLATALYYVLKERRPYYQAPITNCCQ